MSLIVKETSGTFEPAPTGTHLAICVGVIDLGTQRHEYQGKVSYRNDIIIKWELPNEPLSTGEHAGQPHVISKFYTASLSEKSNLRADLKNWRGREFTAQELAAFDLKNILGVPCMLSVTLNGKDKPVVSAVMAAPKGTTKPEQFNPSVCFSLSAFDQATFEGLSDGIKKMIVASPEYLALTEGQPPHDDLPPEHGDDDSLPF